MLATVLLVDDDDAVRALLRRVLETGGFAVLEAGSGREALQAARGANGPVHVLVTDVEMPGMNGPELAEALRALRPATLLIYITGNRGALSRRHAAGSARVLEKPFAPEELLEAVRHAVR